MPTPSSDPLARARLQGKRAALGVVMGVAVVFIAASAVQIVPAIFGANVTPLPDVDRQKGPATDRDRDVAVCAQGIRRRLDHAIDRAAAPAAEPEREWPDEGDVRGACEKSPAGLDAWASLARLRSAERQLKGGQQQELGPLLRDVGAHLPSDLR